MTSLSSPQINREEILKLRKRREEVIGKIVKLAQEMERHALISRYPNISGDEINSRLADTGKRIVASVGQHLALEGLLEILQKYQTQARDRGIKVDENEIEKTQTELSDLRKQREERAKEAKKGGNAPKAWPEMSSKLN